MNDGRCPECERVIRMNMARHLRLVHTKYVCFWRYPVLSCSLWFTSELNAKDHIEGIHHFKEGHGTSFYECLRQYGMEWFGSRAFFEDDDRPPYAMPDTRVWSCLLLCVRSCFFLVLPGLSHQSLTSRRRLPPGYGTAGVDHRRQPECYHYPG